MFSIDSSRITGKFLLLTSCAMLIFTSCKKSKNQQDEDLPVLGVCNAVTPGPGLTRVNEQIFDYESGGGATIRIIRTAPESLVILMGDKSYTNFNIEFWGDADPGELSPASHENLNGKHIKDRFANNRTIIFRDGTKMTYVSPAPWYFGGITAISIYDGDRMHHFNMSCYTLEYSSVNGAAAKHFEEMQPDGETSTYEITETGLIYYNIYTEDTPGQKIEKRENLGSLSKDNLNQVNDYFDDPRLSYT